MVIKIKMGLREASMAAQLIDNWLKLYYEQQYTNPSYLRNLEAQILEGCGKKLIRAYKDEKPLTFSFTRAEIDCIAKNCNVLTQHIGPALALNRP
jgi:hypothetical protein